MTALFDAPELAPIVLCERNDAGWRGLTADGELYNVDAANIPERLCISNRHGAPVGYHALPKELTPAGTIDAYLAHFDRARHLMFANNPTAALPEIDRALDLAATTRAHFNRAMILLGLGRWREGLDVYERCERTPPFMRPNRRDALACGLKPWQGQRLAHKHLLLTHDHGFGDTIMCLRFVPMLRRMGAEVTLMVPPELTRLAAQCGEVTDMLIEADYFCSFLHLLTMLKISPDTVPLDPYLTVDPGLVDKWRARIGRPATGVAWSVGVRYDGDYPRSISLAELTSRIGRERTFVSVQQQGAAEADALGVANFRFEDFADCAALMSLLDEIVTVDTAALHLAGAIGHPNITALLSHWASWRWLSPWYRNLKICRQQTAGDWASAQCEAS